VKTFSCGLYSNLLSSLVEGGSEGTLLGSCWWW